MLPILRTFSHHNHIFKKLSPILRTFLRLIVSMPHSNSHLALQTKNSPLFFVFSLLHIEPSAFYSPRSSSYAIENRAFILVLFAPSFT